MPRVREFSQARRSEYKMKFFRAREKRREEFFLRVECYMVPGGVVCCAGARASSSLPREYAEVWRLTLRSIQNGIVEARRRAGKVIRSVHAL